MATALPSHVCSGPVGPSSSNLKIKERVDLLRASALFKGLSEAECNAIASSARTRSFARDELLFMQGEPVRQLVFLQSGSVKHTQVSSGGDEVILRMSGSGDVVVMPSKSSCENHTCSARAMEPCSSLEWEHNSRKSLPEGFPQIGKNINQILSNRLTELEERFREVATEKVAKRLAFALLRLVKQVGKPAHGGIEVSFSREELAQMTGTTLFTVSRLLSKWGEEGLILARREAVVVRDARRLMQLSFAEE